MALLCKDIRDSRLPVATACMTLDVSRTGYKHWEKREPCATVKQQTDLEHEIRHITREFLSYGYRRVTAELKRRGLKANHKKVLKTMKECGLTRKRHVFRVCTTDSNHSLRTYPNHIKGLKVQWPNKAWVSDITYIGLAKGNAYLAVIIDLFSRKCIGWQLSRNIDAQLCLDALDMALQDRQGMKLTDLIHHSDQGVQYASKEYTAKLEAQGIQISMSRKGNPYDNAFAESFIKTLKYEEVYMNEYADFNDAFNNIENFIEEVYNKKRIHSSIGYITPEECEKQWILNKVCA